MRIVLVAGESSGDTLGADYIEQIKKQHPDAEFKGIGGEKMIQAGLESWFDMDLLSVMGVGEVLARLASLIKLRKNLYQKILAYKPDSFVGIDAPDFNLGLEKKLKDKGIHTIHYVSPTIWAWRPGRIHKIMAATDKVLCLFPFEVAIYKKAGHDAEFVGHPLAKQIPMKVDQNAARKKLGLDKADTVIALLPGSRKQELERLLLLFVDVAERVCRRECCYPREGGDLVQAGNATTSHPDDLPLQERHPDDVQHPSGPTLQESSLGSQNAVNPSMGARARTSCSRSFGKPSEGSLSISKQVRFLLPIAKPSLKPLIEPYLDQFKALGIQVIDGKAGDVLAACDAALVTSGTATLETMLYKKPAVVVYKTSVLTYFIGKCMVKLNFLALPNILAGKELMPEFIQSEATAKNIAPALLAQLDDSHRKSLQAEFEQVHQSLLTNR